MCWSTSQNPTTANSKTSNGSGTGSFTSSLTGLSPGRTYYIRAYAVNSKGTGYGNQISFTTASSYSISGYVKNASTGYGMSGITLTFSNNGGTAVRNSSGYYTKTVNAGWSGTVSAPTAADYTFNPMSRTYNNITSSQFNQDFSGTPVTYTISGYVRTGSNVGISGVTVSFSNNGGSAITGSTGYYSKPVYYGWSGTATPQKSGYTFTPANRSYSSITSNQSSQNYTGTPTAIPNINVSPQSLIFNNPNQRSARQAAEPITESMEYEESEPFDGQYAMGLVIPEEVKEHWKTHTPTREYRSRRNLPSVKDWSGYDTPVRNQGSCGSCWAFAAVALIENLANQANLSIDNNLAEQVLVSCLYNGQGCRGGWYWIAFDYIKKNGIPPENCYPYRANNGNCSSQCATPDFKAKVTSFTPARGLWGESNFNVNDLRGALQDGPLCVAMYVPDSFYSYRSGIYKYTGGNYSFGHAVLLVGYDDTQRYFKAKNSWGTSWGEGGYFRISYDDVTSKVKFGCYAATASGIFIEGQSGQIQEITVKNTGTDNLTVNSITTDKSWLTVTPTSFSNISPNGQQKISVAVNNWNAVFPPQDTATITINSNDPDGSSVKVQVTAMMAAMTDRPVLMVSPPFYASTSTDAEGNLTINVGNSGGETFLDIGNGGEGNMDWTASTLDSWLSITQGSSGTNSGQVMISYSTNTSSARTGTVTISSGSASNAPQTVSIYQSDIDEDKDKDGMPDYFEIIYGFDISNPDDASGDKDGDGLTNLEEYLYKTNPLIKDTDNDTFSDGYEILKGTDPTNPNSYPPPALDFNCDAKIDLMDVIVALQVLIGITPDICLCGNVSIGLKEAIQVLQAVGKQ